MPPFLCVRVRVRLELVQVRVRDTQRNIPWTHGDRKVLGTYRDGDVQVPNPDKPHRRISIFFWFFFTLN